MSIESNFLLVLEQLVEVAHDNKKACDIDNGLAEITINGIEYQIQISLIANKKIWCKPNEVRFSEIVKVHD